jgi:carboxyl-terminal processing protease
LFLTSLDDYSEFVPSSIAPDLIKIDGLPEYSGIGIDLSRGKDGITCMPYPGENASLEGVLNGDLLLQVDGREITRETTIYEAAMRMRGKRGTKAHIRVRHTDGGGVQDIQIERAEVQQASVEVRPDRGHGHHIRISAITATTAKAVREALLTIGPGKALLLDFRGNMGGGFDAATRIAELFLPKGTAIATLQRRGDKQKYISDNATPYIPSKLTILQDGFTASGAELIIAALTAHAPLRARTLGTPTYGKGVAQDSLAPKKSGEWGIVKITSLKMYGPRNEDWDKRGLPADDEIPKELR